MNHTKQICGLGTASESCYTNIIQQIQAFRFSQEYILRWWSSRLWHCILW